MPREHYSLFDLSPLQRSANPSDSDIAKRRFFSSTSRLEYSGSSMWLKHVCADGSRVSSSPLREITNRSFDSPSIGERSLHQSIDA